MSEFSKHEIKRHPSITFIFVHFIITSSILVPIQDIYHMKRDIKVLSTKSYHNQGSLDKLYE